MTTAQLIANQILIQIEDLQNNGEFVCEHTLTKQYFADFDIDLNYLGEVLDNL